MRVESMGGAPMTTTPRFDQVQRIHHDLSQAVRQADRPQPLDLGGGGELSACDVLPESFSFAEPIEELLDVYLRNFTGRGIPKSRPVQPVNMHLLFTAHELDEGAHLPLHVPTFGICRVCGGSGTAGFSVCDRCQGQGFTEQIRTINVPIPPHTPQGTLIPVSLRTVGVDNLYLSIHVSLQD
jgi:hypothetical protein